MPLNISALGTVNRVGPKAKLLLKRSNNRGPKWQWSTKQASSTHLIHGTSLLSTPQPLWTSIIVSSKK